LLKEENDGFCAGGAYYESRIIPLSAVLCFMIHN
jgi:hypothetical protein